MKSMILRRFISSLLLVPVAMFTSLPLSAFGAGVELATVPMASSTSTTVRPNLMFVLDDSGSMDGDFLPNEAKDFVNTKYGFYSSQCNGNYYNPAITYLPAVTSAGAPLNATATTFTSAYRTGFKTSDGSVNLNTGFKGGSGTGNSASTLTAGMAFYYAYSGSQTTDLQKNYADQSSTFYQECNSTVSGTPGSGVFTKRRLATTATATITVTPSPTAGSNFQFRVTGASSNARVSEIELSDNSTDILSGSTSTTGTITNAVLATRIAGKISDCTAGATGSCDVSGYSATVGTGADDNLVTVAWNGTGSTPSNGMLNIVVNQGSATFTLVQDWTIITNTTTVSSILVGATQLLSSSASGGTRNSLASDIQSKIAASGYSATVSGNVVTITGPAASANLTPVITASSAISPPMVLVTEAFPDTDATKLQNFANWYSYYSNRMLMMKTGAGRAFLNVNDTFRVGFATMNNNVSPGFLAVDTFTGTQRTNFYTKLYESNPDDTTPLREVLSRMGQYFSHKFGQVDKYKATLTLSGSASTSVDSVKVGGIEILEFDTTASTSSSTLAQQIANSINSKVSTDFGASRSGSVVTISGPASAFGQTPVVSKSGTMSITAAGFTKTTTTSSFNDVTPADPIQYSCQQNFTILSTDGYWNGPNTYDLSNNNVGNVDGSAVRPYNDGATATNKVTITYTNNQYSASTCSCGSGNKKLKTQPRIGSCDVNVAGTPTGSESCTPGNWADNGSSSCSGSCVSSPTIPSPNPSVSAVQSRVTTLGPFGGYSNTLADVALYYYQTDLRDNSLGNCTGALNTSVCENNVFISGADNQTQQHMTTFTLGLGVRGRMVYSSSYLTDTTGDFPAVKLGSTASSSVCTWQTAGTVCNWPEPVSGTTTTVDDLWHAAVNGRGAYFSASDPNSLGNALANALVSIKSKVGAAAAAATSTLNPVAGNNQAFVASYTTQKWTGNLEARGINTETGVVNENANWCVENVAASNCTTPSTVISDSSGDTTTYFCSTPDSVTCPSGTLSGTDCNVPVAVACTGTMNAKVADLTDTRVIKTANSAGTGLTDFDTTYRAANSAHFNATLLAGLSQWPPVSDVSTAADYFRANAHGDNLLKFLRGQRGHEFDRSTVATIDQFYRNRSAVLGDALESQPAFIGAPIFTYPYPGYNEFKTGAAATRGGTVYMGTNDGMLHAFASDSGGERWAYVPSMVIANMWKLADKQYADRHTNYVNGSPITTDICTANCSNAVTGVVATDPVWKTIVVSGLNGGGRGYFALDITDPTTPKLMWEFTTTAGIGVVTDNDLGYTFGQPVVTRKSDGTWVVLVTSGYDNGTDSATKVAGSFVPNSPAGSGVGFLYVLNATTGAIISKISTGVGSAGTPSGLAKIGGFNAEPGGNRASFVYGGDLLGNLWRFDINSSASATIGTGAAFKLATLFSDSAGTQPQPVMTTPILGSIQGKRVVFIGTGKYLEISDLTTSTTQTQYAIKDDDATVTLANPRTSSAMVQQFLINNPDGTATRLVAASSGSTVAGVNPVNFGVNRGWFVDLPESRERVNIDARLVLGTLLVPSIVPSSTDCSPGGSGWLNFLDYTTGGSINPSPGLAGVKYDSTIVGVNVLYIEGKPVVEVVTSTNPTPTIQPDVEFKKTGATFAGKRVMWRELMP